MSELEEQIINAFIKWADSTPAVTWGGSDGVKDRWRKLQAAKES